MHGKISRITSQHPPPLPPPPRGARAERAGEKVRGPRTSLVERALTSFPLAVLGLGNFFSRKYF